MKISILVPVYNEEELIINCLKSLINQDYPKKDYEIIVINDGSKDNTKKNIEEFIKENKKVKIKLINQENKGLASTRLIGARNAKYENLFFIDSRCKAQENLLSKLKEKDYSPIVSTVLINKEDYIGRFHYLFRKKLYGKSYMQGKFERFFITEENFEKVPSGAGILFIKKDLFLESQFDNIESKNCSDDIKLSRNIVKKKPILRDPEIIVSYKPRSNLTSHLKHVFHRGPKFIDYHLKLGDKYLLPIIVCIFLPIFSFILLTINLKIFFILYIILFILCIVTFLYLSEEIKDFFILSFLLPITFIFFYFGILKGIVLKLANK